MKCLLINVWSYTQRKKQHIMQPLHKMCYWNRIQQSTLTYIVMLQICKLSTQLQGKWLWRTTMKEEKSFLWILLIFCSKNKYFLSSKIHNAFSHSQLLVFEHLFIENSELFSGFSNVSFPPISSFDSWGNTWALYNARMSPHGPCSDN